MVSFHKLWICWIIYSYFWHNFMFLPRKRCVRSFMEKTCFSENKSFPMVTKSPNQNLLNRIVAVWRLLSFLRSKYQNKWATEWMELISKNTGINKLNIGWNKCHHNATQCLKAHKYAPFTSKRALSGWTHKRFWFEISRFRLQVF